MQWLRPCDGFGENSSWIRAHWTLTCLWQPHAQVTWNFWLTFEISGWYITQAQYFRLLYLQRRDNDSLGIIDYFGILWFFLFQYL
jgi:hypothetical protein